MTYKSVRTIITPKVVAEALRFAARASDATDIHDYFDERQHYLELRQRGRSVKWLVRAKGRTQTIGTAIPDRRNPNYLSLKDAQRRAGEIFFGMPPPQPAAPVSPQSRWTWAELDRRYQESLRLPRKTGKKIKRPSRATQDDVRLCFGKSELARWQTLRLVDMTPLHLIALINAVHDARGHRSCEKTLAYVKAALSWAQSQRPLESGLADKMPWWSPLKPAQPTATEIEAMEARASALVAAKTEFTIAHLGELLVRHEQFCAQRRGNEKISPGIRWGVWWLALTANRSFTITKLRRNAMQWDDPRNTYSTTDQPWGIAEWPADQVKNKIPFMLPIPPMGLHIVRSCMWDWGVRVSAKSGFRDMTEWVFASTRRRHRATHPDNPDPSVYPNSLAAHLRALRGLKGSNTIDHLADLPELWPHLIRSVTTNFFALHRLTVPPAAASAMLGHVLSSDKEIDPRRMSKTTEEYYLTAQYMDLKAMAMKVWSEALMEAYVNAGGRLPMPCEKDPSKPEGPGWIRPVLGPRMETRPSSRLT